MDPTLEAGLSFLSHFLQCKRCIKNGLSHGGLGLSFPFKYWQCWCLMANHLKNELTLIWRNFWPKRSISWDLWEKNKHFIWEQKVYKWQVVRQVRSTQFASWFPETMLDCWYQTLIIKECDMKHACNWSFEILSLYTIWCGNRFLLAEHHLSLYSDSFPTETQATIIYWSKSISWRMGKNRVFHTISIYVIFEMDLLLISPRAQRNIWKSLLFHDFQRH